MLAKSATGKKTTPSAISGTIFVSRYTRSVSAMMKDAATTTPRASGGAVGRSTMTASVHEWVAGLLPHRKCGLQSRLAWTTTSQAASYRADSQPLTRWRPGRRSGGDGRGDVVVAVVPGDGSPARQQRTRQREFHSEMVAALKASSASFAACRSGKPGTNSALSIAAPLVIV